MTAKPLSMVDGSWYARPWWNDVLLMRALQMDSLMRNDWPDPDSGVRTAFQFALPEEVERILPGSNHWKVGGCVKHTELQAGDYSWEHV